MKDEIQAMRAIITVVGQDQVGIIAKLSVWLAEHKINIVDISQTILSDNFVMMTMVDFEKADISIAEVRAALDKIGIELGVTISIMHEKVFSAMHRV